jgi:Cys-tRNA(Pro) deacylase
MNSATDISPDERLIAFVIEQGVEATLLAPNAEMPTVPLAAAALGVTADQIVKTIVFEGKKANCVGVAIVPGDVRVDRARVAAVLGLPTLRLADAETVKRTIGFEVGGVPPVGHLTRVPVVVDVRVLDHTAVYGGGGDEHHMLQIAPGDIVRLTNAVVADVTVHEDADPRLV